MQDLIVHPSLVESPGRILLIAGVFAVVAALVVLLRVLRAPVKLRLWPSVTMVVLWVAAAWWEASLQGKGYNIRVDLLLFHPVLTILSVAALATTAWPLSRGAGEVAPQSS